MPRVSNLYPQSFSSNIMTRYLGFTIIVCTLMCFIAFRKLLSDGFPKEEVVCGPSPVIWMDERSQNIAATYEVPSQQAIETGEIYLNDLKEHEVTTLLKELDAKVKISGQYSQHETAIYQAKKGLDLQVRDGRLMVSFDGTGTLENLHLLIMVIFNINWCVGKREKHLRDIRTIVNEIHV